MTETGTVTHIRGDRGFGFIEADDGSGDLFLHATGMAKGEVFETLDKGQKVSYVRSHDKRGYRAVQVRPIT